MVRSQVALAEAAGFKTDKAMSLLQVMPEVPKQDYDFHSGGIVDLLKDFETDWTQKKNTEEKDEQVSADEFNNAADAKRGEIDSAQSTIDTKTKQLEQCEKKAREWDQRSAKRRDELAALTKAIGIIKDGVSANEAASGAGGRPTLLTQGKPARKVAVIQ